MSDSSKTPKASMEKSSYDKLYSLDYNDINNDFYHLVNNDLLMQVVESKVKKSCPSNVDYIVVSDSEDESPAPPTEQNQSTKNLQTEQKQKRDKNPSFIKSSSNEKNEKENLEMIIPKKNVSPSVKKSDSSENLEDKNTQAKVSSTKCSSPLVYQSSSNEKLKDKSSDVKPASQIFSSPLVFQSFSNEKLKDKSSDVKTASTKCSSPLVCQSSSNEKLKDKSSDVKTASTKCSSPLVCQSSSNEKTEKKNLDTVSVEKNMISVASASLRRSISDEKISVNNSSVSNSDCDDDFPLSRLLGDCKSSGDESDFDDLSEKLIKKEWCICSNSHVKENLKTCDKCGQWFHILCAADAKTIKKVQSGVKVSLIDDFKCLLCRNDREAMKKFDPKMIEQRIKLRNERLSLSNSDEEKINRIYLGKTDDQDAKKTSLKKNLNEKTQLVKDRTQEQKKTKFLTHMESADKSRITKKSTSTKFFPPKQLIQKKSIHDAKKLPTNQTNSAINRPCQSHTPKRSVDLVKNTAPSERKTKLIGTPTTTTVHRTVKVTSDRENTKCLLFKSLKDRVEHADHLDITDQHIDSLCHQIEQQIHNQLSETNEYMNRIKVIRMNVNDKANKTFFRKILTGQIKPDQLPLMDKNEMKDDDLRRQDEEFLRQDLRGRIEQSNELNEDIRKKQEALRVRKGIDDDLTTLGTFTTVTDLNNNDKVTEEHSEPVEQPTMEIFFQTEEPNVAQNEKKRKHDSDFESDTEVQPLAKISKNIVPQLNISLSHIPIITKQEFKISSDITWSGSLNLSAPDISFKLRVHMINLNDLDPTSNRFRLLETFKQRLTMKAITDFKLVDVPHINVWNLSVNHYLAFKFEPNMNQKSLLQPQYISSLKEYESSEVLLALYKKMKPSTFSYSIQLPESFQDIAERIILCPVRSKTGQSSSEQEFDANLKDKYSITLKRSVDSVLGFLVPKVLDDGKKTSPDQSKMSSRKEEVRDPRMRKSVKTSPNQQAEQNGSCSLRTKASEELSKGSPGQIGNHHESGHLHKVISLDAYKQKHKLTSDRIESVPMDIDPPEQPPVITNSDLIDTILATIGPATSHLNKLAILHNMSNMSALKSLSKQELDELTQKYANSLPEFVDMVQKLGAGEKMEEKQSENCGDGQNGLMLERKVENCDKMVLPPKEKWQGSTKESFENLLRLHKISKERKSNGLSHDLTFESQNWKLDERNFKPLDENLLNKNVCVENERKVSDSETNVSSDGMSSCEDVAPAKKIRGTARKSVSGIVRRFKVADQSSSE